MDSNILSFATIALPLSPLSVGLEWEGGVGDAGRAAETLALVMVGCICGIERVEFCFFFSANYSTSIENLL